MGWLAAGAGIFFGLALVLLMAFFVTKDERLDRVAEWCFVAFALLAVPTILKVAGLLSDGGLIVQAATALGVIGVAAIGLGELGSTLRLVDFRRIATAVTLGFLGFLSWIGLVSVAMVSGTGGLPLVLGWLGIVSIVVGLAIVFWILRRPGVMGGDALPGSGEMASFIMPMSGIVVWMIWLGLSL